MEQIQISVIKNIYSLFNDDISKYIFENRLMYNLTEDKKYIRNVICTTDVCQKIYKRMKTSTQKKFLFGAGSIGRRMARIYDDIKFECFIDNYCAGETYEGLAVISAHEFETKYSEALVVISTVHHHKEIKHQLLEIGVKEENIINIGMEYEKMNHLQYFDLPELENNKEMVERFVDGGCYDGKTSVDFMNWCKSKEWGGRVYAWEPDPVNREKCKQLFEKNDISYEMIPKGLWSKSEVLKFRIGGRGSSISDIGDMMIEVDSIDNLINEPITFIKMDIEGSEYQALLGAQNTIKRYKPKLAISIYHKPEDIWELPQLIHTINSDYIFYLRHYSFGDNETVLYALPKGSRIDNGGIVWH